MISPPLPMPEFLEAAEDVLDFIRSKGSTDNRCGLHVHMSIEGINLKDNLDVVKLFMFHDEDKVYQAFQDRKFNNYAAQVKNKIEDVNFDVDDLKKIINVSKLEKNLSTTKYYGINLSNIEKNHIEFRYMGG
ncbi:MAG: amidoligase family protein, partial [Halanaerobiales bacterium]